MTPAPRRAKRSTTPTPDGRHLLIDGRRWRRSDPAIPDALRAELVRELMSARRAVLAAKRAASVSAEKAARARVNDAKLALGERGRAYWEPADVTAQRIRAAATMRALLAQRGPGKTICPSDIARTIGAAEWRTLMPLVRELAIELADAGALVIKQRGRRVDARNVTGPIRLASSDSA